MGGSVSASQKWRYEQSRTATAMCETEWPRLPRSYSTTKSPRQQEHQNTWFSSINCGRLGAVLGLSTSDCWAPSSLVDSRCERPRDARGINSPSMRALSMCKLTRRLCRCSGARPSSMVFAGSVAEYACPFVFSEVCECCEALEGIFVKSGCECGT